MVGMITQHIDATQLLVAGFFLFFAGLVYYLRQEDMREGYPLQDETGGRPSDSWPRTPPAKTYRLLQGGTTQMPHDEPPAAIAGRALLRFPGAPMVPLGDPMLAEIGPGAYPLRKDAPMLLDGEPQVRPLRATAGWIVPPDERDPRGMTVLDGRHVTVGTVRELWVDRSVKIIRYLEVELTPGLAAAAERPRVLVPIYHAVIHMRRGVIRVPVLLAHQFATIPSLARDDQITAREEDRVTAYYAAAQLYGRGREGGLILHELHTGAAEP